MSVGVSEARIDAAAKLTGEADYPGDRIGAGALWAMAVFTDQPHARLLEIDLSAAEAVEGVVAVFGSADVPVNEFGLTMADHPVFVGLDPHRPQPGRLRRGRAGRPTGWHWWWPSRPKRPGRAQPPSRPGGRPCRCWPTSTSRWAPTALLHPENGKTVQRLLLPADPQGRHEPGLGRRRRGGGVHLRVPLPGARLPATRGRAGLHRQRRPGDRRGGRPVDPRGPRADRPRARPAHQAGAGGVPGHRRRLRRPGGHLDPDCAGSGPRSSCTSGASTARWPPCGRARSRSSGTANATGAASPPAGAPSATAASPRSRAPPGSTPGPTTSPPTRCSATAICTRPAPTRCPTPRSTASRCTPTPPRPGRSAASAPRRPPSRPRARSTSWPRRWAWTRWRSAASIRCAMAASASPRRRCPTA